MMLNKIIISLILLCIIPGCALKSIKPTKEQLHVKNEIFKKNKAIVTLKDLKKHETNIILDNGITRKEAIYLALNNNPTMLAEFDNLGIAKSDVIQAGLFTNPRIDTIFALPQQSNMKSDIQTTINMTISDFWQVPLRKKIAKDQLEIVTLQLINTIFDTIQMTKDLYNRYLYAQEQLKIIQMIIDDVEQLKEQIMYRQQFGLTSDLDTYLIDTLLNSWKLEQLEYKKMHENAGVNLRNTLGIDINNDALPLIDPFYYTPSIDSLDDLQEYAIQNRPEVLIANMNIQQAKDTLSYERSRWIKEVNVGFYYERNLDGTKERGPSVGFDIPIFDTNYAQIYKAKTALIQQEKKFGSIASNVIQDVYNAYNIIKRSEEQLKLYDTTIVSYKKALDYAQQYGTSMQLSFVILFQTYLDYYQMLKKQIETVYNYMNGINALERAIGKTLEMPSTI